MGQSNGVLGLPLILGELLEKDETNKNAGRH